MQRADPDALSERAWLGPHAQHPWIVFVAPARPGTTSGAEAVSQPGSCRFNGQHTTPTPVRLWHVARGGRATRHVAGERAGGRSDVKRTAWLTADGVSCATWCGARSRR